MLGPGILCFLKNHTNLIFEVIYPKQQPSSLWNITNVSFKSIKSILYFKTVFTTVYQFHLEREKGSERMRSLFSFIIMLKVSARYFIGQEKK